MRLHAHRDHADYHLVSMHAKVLLDGREINLCVHADEEQGRVEYYRQDAKGRLIVVGDEAVTATACGDVQIIIPPEHHRLLKEFPFGPVETNH